MFTSPSPCAPRASRDFAIEQLEKRCLLSGYTLIDLGGPFSSAYDINEAGQVVGSAASASGLPHAFLWDDGVGTDLGTLGGPTSTANGLNEAGQVVGGSRVSSSNFTNDAFVWENGVMSGLGFLKDPSAGAINEAGQVVGSFHRDPVPPSQVEVRWAFLWENGVARSLFEGFAADINETGLVAGAWESSRGYPVAAIWDAASGPRELGVLPGGLLSEAYGINEAGHVVGWSESFTGNNGFLWDGSQMIDLGVNTVGADINNAGTIVGGSNIWVNGVRSDLNSLVVENFGLTVVGANAINEAGQIAGIAYDAQGRAHAVLLNPVSQNVPSISINDVSVIEGNTGTKTAVFTVSLSEASTETVTLAFATANGSATSGSDYQSASGTVTFEPGQTARTISVVINGDRAGEPNETFAVNLSAATNAVFNDNQGIGTILDDEPRIIIGDVARSEGNAGTTAFVFTVSLSAAYDAPVTVNFATANGTAKSNEDYTAASGTLTFAPGQTTQTITVGVKGDKKKEANETFFVNLFGGSGALILDGQGLGTIQDDDRGGTILNHESV
jgi:probable HAF family extracellular repeat protein